jgi:glyoxylase-like metal-dependent hydrolase (beta-lactamase superfamily II)
MKRTLSALATALTLTFAGMSPSVYAAAPQVKTQAPGFYRFFVGDFEVTAISDGTVKLPVLNLLKGAKPQQLAAALKAGYLKENVETSCNTYLINTGTKLILVDTGAAGLFGPTLGNLLANLQAAGYKPEQVDDILITHMHPDHVGGLMSAGAIAFPNATLHIDKADTDYWLSDANLAAAPEGMKGFFQGAMASVNPYVKAGKLKTFQGETEFAPGVKSQAAHGHTPGHSFYTVESKGEKLQLWGDLMHVGAVQFGNPAVTIGFDSSMPAAAQARQKAFADAAKNGYMVGVTHVAFPGVGHLRKAAGGKGYEWVPLNYSSLK